MGSSDGLMGLVVGVPNADTVEIRVEGRVIRVRLRYVDSPENGQAAAPWCNRQAEAHLLGKQVMVQPGPMDGYGRLVSEVMVHPWGAIGREFCRRGIAVVYKQYGWGHWDYVEAEAFARLHGLGLWRYLPYMAPWTWRQLHSGHGGPWNARWRNRGRP